MKIILPVKGYQKFRSYINGTQYEISGLGKISRVDDEFTIEDVKIFKQYVSSGETVLDRRELGKFYDETIQKNEDLSKWKLWWHSHADFNVFYSGTDEDTIKDFDNETHIDNWMLSIVSNHKAEMLARLDIFYPLRCTISEIDWEISFEDREIKLNALDEIIEKLIPREGFRQQKKSEIDFSKRKVPLFPLTKTAVNIGEVIDPNTGLPFVDFTDL